MNAQAPTQKRGVGRTMYTVDEVAERWNLNRKTVYEMVQKGALPSRRFGRAVRIPAKVVEGYEQGSVEAGGVNAR